MLNNIVKFKFDFGNSFKYLISYIVEILENIGMIILTWIVIFSVENIIFGDLKDGFAKEIIFKVLFVITIIMDLFFAVLIFIPKRVILTDDKILVHRFCFPLQVTFWDIRGFNDKIYYSQIILCQKYTDKTLYGARKTFFCVNNDSLVEIRTKQRTYLLPIKKYERFICEVNKKILKETGDSSSC